MLSWAVPLPLLHVRGYDVGVVERQIQNNGFDVAVRYLETGGEEYEAEALAAFVVKNSPKFDLVVTRDLGDVASSVSLI